MDDVRIVPARRRIGFDVPEESDYRRSRVLSDKLLTIDPDTMKDVTVDMTVTGGRIDCEAD